MMKIIVYWLYDQQMKVESNLTLVAHSLHCQVLCHIFLHHDGASNHNFVRTRVFNNMNMHYRTRLNNFESKKENI